MNWITGADECQRQVPGVVVGLPLFNGRCSLDQLCRNGKEHQMPWPQEGTGAPLEQFSENLCSICCCTQNENNRTGCLNNARELEESQCNRIMKINAVTLPEKKPYMRYRSPLLQKDTKERERVQMRTMINTENII